MTDQATIDKLQEHFQFSEEEEHWAKVKGTRVLMAEFDALNTKLWRAAEQSKHPTHLVLKSFWSEALEVMGTTIDEYIKMVEETWGANEWEDVE